MDEQISEEVKKERLKRLNDTVAKGLKAGSEKYIGQEGEVLVEGCDHRGEPMAYGKLPCFKMVYFKGDESMIGLTAPRENNWNNEKLPCRGTDIIT